MLTIFVAGIVALVAFEFARQWRSAAQVVWPLTAFTVTRVHTLSRADGTVTLQMAELCARSSEGAVVDQRVNIRPGNTEEESRAITLPKARKYLVVSDSLEALSTYYLSPAAAAEAREKASDPTCRQKSIGATVFAMKGVATSLGHHVVKLAAENKGAHFESWEAPELDCFPLYSLTITKNADGSVNSRDEQVTTSVVTGEPQAALFAVPATYSERPPSEVTAMLLSRFENFDAKTCPTCTAAAERLDRNYYASRQHMPEP
ncbi:MAG: hypothetical protein IT158_18535 [Bryobacterales bacterium]|nr:hypothetical protein [Bryobacterales bacterium]